MFSLKQNKLLIAVALIVIGLVSTWSLGNYHNTLLEKRKEETRLHVLNAYELFHYYHEKANIGELTEEQAQSYAAESIRKISPVGTNYYWINDLYPKMIMHVKFPELEERDLTNYAGSDGFRLFVAIAELAKKDNEGFINYMWSKPDEEDKEQLYAKLSYIKLYEPWGWVLGSGVYYDDIKNAFWRSLFVVLGISVAILFFIWALGMTVTESLRK